MPNLGNSPGIDTLVRDGKVYLSIDDAVGLTLENNLDLDIAPYNLNIAEPYGAPRQDIAPAGSNCATIGIAPMPS
jgi:hypothetical protein